MLFEGKISKGPKENGEKCERKRQKDKRLTKRN
jgi:hypothetical protein